MKRLLFCLVAAIIGSTVLITPTHALDTNNFYIQDYTVNFYLSRDEQGISHLKTVEDITAIFPDYDQNHGLTRLIPTTNQDGNNVTLDSLDSLTVTRNGQPENIAKVEKSKTDYTIYLGDANTYVHGEQQYRLEYEFTKVITDFGLWQELYWDAAQTESLEFRSVSVSLHLDDDLLDSLQEDPSCYVGSYGADGQSRCFISQLSDGYSFSAFNLDTYEQLTFAVAFEPDTFTVPAPSKNYILVINFAAITLVGIILLILLLHRRTKVKDQIRYAKDLFLAPQYTPLKGYTVAELSAAALYPGSNVQVATMLELAVSHKIEIIKGEKKLLGKQKWSIKLLSDQNLSEEQTILLKILNGGTMPAVNEEVEIKTRTATSTLEKLSRSFKTVPEESVKKKGDLIDAPKGHYRVISLSLLWLFASFFATFALTSYAEEEASGIIVGGWILVVCTVLTILALFIIMCNIQGTTTRYTTHTQQGLDHDNYLNGLKLYIKMAEADRLAFLQSVKGADTSNKGIVKLYEKLLPYAALFGLEKSWTAELARYYELEPSLSPAWYVGVGAFSASDFSSAMHSVSSSVSASTSSSSSSGSGGGGFSGGGGGGGSVGGW